VGRSHLVTIGDFEFPTKASAKDFFRAIRDRYPRDGEHLSFEDEGIVRDLLGAHPESVSKVGVGIAFITVETETEFNRTRHFMIHRLDGSCTDFSFHACIDGRNVRNDILGALRRAIADQIVEFRNSFFEAKITMICPLSGNAITSDSYHVDHAPPAKFIALVNNWLEDELLALEDVEITPPADSQIVADMISQRQRSSWAGFHRREASLRMLSPIGNLSHANRKASPL
jgi:hypothetical protein